MVTMDKEPQVPSSAPSPTGLSNFAMAFAWLREDYQKVQKRSNTSPEQSPQQTRRRKSTESGDSTDLEISKETEMLEITSPRKPRPTRYEQYLAEGGQQLIMRIPLPEDYAATGLPLPEDYAKGAIPKCPVCEYLGPELAEDMEVTKLEQGDIADEAYQAWQAHEEGLFTRMKCREEDLKAQEQRKWEEDTCQQELKKKKRERERSRNGRPSRKLRNRTGRRRNQTPAWRGTPSWKILSRKVSPRFHQSPRKLWLPINPHTGVKDGAQDNLVNPLIVRSLMACWIWRDSPMTACIKPWSNDSLGRDEHWFGQPYPGS